MRTINKKTKILIGIVAVAVIIILRMIAPLFVPSVAPAKIRMNGNEYTKKFETISIGWDADLENMDEYTLCKNFFEWSDKGKGHSKFAFSKVQAMRLIIKEDNDDFIAVKGLFGGASLYCKDSLEGKDYRIPVENISSIERVILKDNKKQFEITDGKAIEKLIGQYAENCLNESGDDMKEKVFRKIAPETEGAENEEYEAIVEVKGWPVARKAFVIEDDENDGEYQIWRME
ncbi:MAG: hypothetical protein K6G65_10130 [Lachnospiraceae bacterium]|nr:hypothetical protein [Lachnospiraceae bacterium]